MQSTLNQTIALFTPSSAIALSEWKLCLDFFKKKKISVKYPPLTTAKSELIAGSPKQRYSQIKELLGNKLFLAVRAIDSGNRSVATVGVPVRCAPAISVPVDGVPNDRFLS